MNQLQIDFTPPVLRATGPVDWLLSFRETQRELRANAGLETPAVRLVAHAAAVSGDRRLIDMALCELVEREYLTPVRYAPWFPSPIFPPDPAYGSGGKMKAAMAEPDGWEFRRSPSWVWVFKVASDVAKHLPPTHRWQVRHLGRLWEGCGTVPSYLEQGERVL